jgi:aconitate hydratase
MTSDSLGWFDLAGRRFLGHRLAAVPGAERLPVSLKILLENLLRHEDGGTVTADQITALCDRRIGAALSFFPSRVFLHDTNGVPVLTDLAALRDAVAAAGHDPARVRPRVPAHLTVDHSIAAEFAGTPDALRRNIDLEYRRNAERFAFLRWGERLEGMRVVPPGAGIMHQINLEVLATVVEFRDGRAYPDTCAGTDSHTTMVNALGVLAWGVGGIEAEVALLGQPVGMVVPPVVGVELVGRLAPTVTATDLVLTIVETLRAHGVVGKFVEFTGPAVATLPLAHRATIANMCPEFGATVALFAIDDATLDYLRLTGRPPEHVAAVEAYARQQGLWHDPARQFDYDERLRVDLGTVTASLAGPRRPQDRLPLRAVRENAEAAISALGGRSADADGAVAIAAITSCTNTSNPHVMVAAGLLARNARNRGLSSRPWVKTSLSPGSRAVTEYLTRAGLSAPLDELGFQVVGYGCMTCIGNSGPLSPTTADAVGDGAIVAAVLSGNRNFDGRINNDVSLNYLASPPLVVAYALAGTVLRDLTAEPLGTDPDGTPVFLADLWPSDDEIDDVVTRCVTSAVFAGSAALDDERWTALPSPDGDLFDWPADSTYLRRPPFLDDVSPTAPPVTDLHGARALLVLGDSVTTDHISPAGRIPPTSSAGRYLTDLGETDLNTYASRRGNFEVMVRGGFANPRLRNLVGSDTPVYEVARSYAAAGVPLLVIAGREYGTGSSRDWAAKATALLGVKAVLARSFERIHRSNLVQLGVLPLQFLDGQDADSLGVTGTETFDILGLGEATRAPNSRVTVRVRPTDRPAFDFQVVSRLDTRHEIDHYTEGGVLPFVFRRFLRGDDG